MPEYKYVILYCEVWGCGYSDNVFHSRQNLLKNIPCLMHTDALWIKHHHTTSYHRTLSGHPHQIAPKRYPFYFNVWFQNVGRIRWLNKLLSIYLRSIIVQNTIAGQEAVVRITFEIGPKTVLRYVSWWVNTKKSDDFSRWFSITCAGNFISYACFSHYI